MLCRESAGCLRQARSVWSSGLSRLSGHLVSLVQPNKQDRPKRPDRRDRPNRPNEQARLAGLFGILLVVLILGIDSMAHGQYVGSCGTPSPLSPASGTGSFEVVPSMCVSERYDSNVFYRPPSPGLDQKDFVTTVNPMLRVNHNGDYASGFLNVGGFSETYAKNPDLNYLGTNDSLSLNLDNSIKRWLPNASLRVTDYFSYTPLPPGFVNPAAGTSPGAPGNIPNVFAQGNTGFRATNLINNGTVSTSYATTASTSLNASYSYAIIRFKGSPSSQGGTNLSNTTTQTGTVGGTARLSGVDALNVRYSHSQTDSTSSSTSSLFKTDSATIGWSRTLTPNLSAQLGGGGILISPGQTTSYAANAALIMNSLNNNATITYSHTAFPSFTGAGGTAGGTAGGILIGDSFSLSAVQRIDRQWQLAESASYVHTSGGGGLNAVTYDSFFAGGDIQYWVTSIWSTSLSYSYSKFTTNTGLSDYDRHVITLSLRATWE